MTRDEILTVVREKALSILSSVKAEDFDEQKSLKDLGADSLDMVEIVSASMRTLRIKVPRSKLDELKNIAALVDLFYATHQQSEGGAPKP